MSSLPTRTAQKLILRPSPRMHSDGSYASGGSAISLLRPDSFGMSAAAVFLGVMTALTLWRRLSKARFSCLIFSSRLLLLSPADAIAAGGLLDARPKALRALSCPLCAGAGASDHAAACETSRMLAWICACASSISRMDFPRVFVASSSLSRRFTHRARWYCISSSADSSGPLEVPSSGSAISLSSLLGPFFSCATATVRLMCRGGAKTDTAPFACPSA
mmetsp:Transcript_39169/g.102099  ORF Transcript_39169/g.102099 Transcript_39169/m.102099 type:complete len:219 (+) Transcript_39169:375-1031(+)